MPTLNLDRYSQDMRALAPLVTDAGTKSPRVQRTGSALLATVNVIAGNTTLPILVQESGLYVKGFRNGQNTTFVFKGETIAGTQLRFGCNYSDPDGLAIFTGSEASDKIAKVSRAKKDIVAAVEALSAFTGGNDLHLKVPLALMAFTVSEALRFTIVYDRIVETCKGAGGTFSFAELKDYVQNWSDMTDGGGPSGVIKNTIFTAHH